MKKTLSLIHFTPSLTGRVRGGAVYGLRSSLNLTRTHATTASDHSADTASLHRFTHEQVAVSHDVEKQPNTPSTFRSLASLILAIVLLLIVALYAVGKR